MFITQSNKYVKKHPSCIRYYKLYSSANTQYLLSDHLCLYIETIFYMCSGQRLVEFTTNNNSTRWKNNVDTYLKLCQICDFRNVKHLPSCCHVTIVFVLFIYHSLYFGTLILITAVVIVSFQHIQNLKEPFSVF